MQVSSLPVFILCLLVILGGGNAVTAQTMSFSKGNLSQAKAKSISEGKLYMAYFYTDWCLPCKWMDDNTFKDAELIQFAQQNYLAVKVNIDDKDGQQMREQYGVEFLPTILLFNQSGDIVDRFEESLTAARLLEAMKKHRLNMAGASVKLPPLKKSAPEKKPMPVEEIKEVPAQEPSPAVVKEEPVVVKERKEEPKKEEVAARKPAPADPPKPADNPTPVKPAEPTPKPAEPMRKPAEEPAPVAKAEPPAPAARNAEPPAATPKTAEPKPVPPATTNPQPAGSGYYAVQVGTYTRFENADARRNELKQVFGEGVHIKIDNSGKETIYRIMVGRYQEADAARELVSLLKQQGIEGFIREIKMD